MARIEVDPNYSSPTFSRATAATDPFKMGDVQNLAAAMSTHDHSTGKGLTLAAGAIPTGLITSTMIADLTIATGDIANGAVTTAKLATNAVTLYAVASGVSATPSTTSNASVDIPDLSVTMATVGGKLIVFAQVDMYITGTVGNVAALQLNVDGGDVAGSVRAWTPTLAVYRLAMPYLYDLSGYAATTHTIKLRWSISGSGTTLSSTGTQRQMIVIELRQ